MIINAIRSVRTHLPELIKTVNVQRLVNELAMGDRAFFFRHFKGFRPAKIGRGRIRRVVEKELLGDGDGHELLANLLIVHWNESHSHLYQEMVAHVKTINDDVEAIEAIEDDKANMILDDMLQRHRPVDLLLCVRLNEVRFSDSVISVRLEGGKPVPEEAPVASEVDESPEPEEVAETPQDDADS